MKAQQASLRKGVYLALWMMTIGAGVVVGTKWDRAFCKSKSAGTNSPQSVMLPDFPQEYSVLQMVSDTNDKTVSANNIAISTKLQKAYLDFHAPSSWTVTYVDVKNKVLRQKDRNNLVCDTQPKNKEMMHSELQVVDTNGVVKIPKLRHFLQFSDGDNPLYVGTTTIRGIPANKWEMCFFRDWDGTTTFARIYYSTLYTFPGTIEPSILMTETYTKNSTTQNVEYKRSDFVNFKRSVQAHSKYFQIPREMWCEGVAPPTQLPSFPQVFQYSAVEAKFADIERKPPPTPVLSTHKHTYVRLMGAFKMFVSDSETNGDYMVNVFRRRKIHDFITGVEYDINLTKGFCVTKNIPTDIDTKPVPDIPDEVSMRSPKEFFDFNTNGWQYLGEHYDFDRDILADVYTSLFKYGTRHNLKLKERTWYIASKNWMMNVMRFKKAFTLPLRMIYTLNTDGTPNEEYFDIYNYNTEPDQDSAYPDISSCMDNPMYLEILIPQAKYEYVYSENAAAFNSALRVAILKNTELQSLLRITNIEVAKLKDNGILVRFTLLGEPTVEGTVVGPLIEIDSETLYSELENAVNTGGFLVNVNNDYGNYSLQATKLRRHTINPKSFAASVAAASSNSGYSPGSMGGLAFGMLIVGFLMAFFAYKGGEYAWNKRKVRNSDEMRLEARVPEPKF